MKRILDASHDNQIHKIARRLADQLRRAWHAVKLPDLGRIGSVRHSSARRSDPQDPLR